MHKLLGHGLATTDSSRRAEVKQTHRTNSPTVQRIRPVFLGLDRSGVRTTRSFESATLPFEDAMLIPSNTPSQQLRLAGFGGVSRRRWKATVEESKQQGRDYSVIEDLRLRVARENRQGARPNENLTVDGGITSFVPEDSGISDRGTRRSLLAGRVQTPPTIYARDGDCGHRCRDEIKIWKPRDCVLMKTPCSLRRYHRARRQILSVRSWW